MKLTLKKLNNTEIEFIHGQVYALEFENDPFLFNGEYRFYESQGLFTLIGNDSPSGFSATAEGVQDLCISVENVKPLIVALCGSFLPFDKGLIRNEVIKKNMVVRGSVNNKTDLLVMAEHSGFKLDKACKLNIPTITLENFITNQLGFTIEQAQKELTVGDTNQRVSEELNEYFNDEIEEFAEELFNINKNTSNFIGCWCDMPEKYKRGYRAMANHVSTPKTDVQQQLTDSLNSERELMGIIRDIGKLFSVNVGVDIGTKDVVEYISKCVSVNDNHRVKYTHWLCL